eukprot:g25384.t1
MGPDNILAIVLKTWAPELAASLGKLFQYSYNTDIYLIIWKTAQAYPVHIQQDTSYPANYHPISLLSIVSKLMESVINSAIKQHLLSNNPIRDTQFVFCQGHSVPDFLPSLGSIMDKRTEFQRL